MSNSIPRAYDFILVLLTLSAAAFMLFYGLGLNPIHIWDESIYVNNALEIAMENKWFVMRVDGEANLYNTKPPLAIWFQALLIKLLGPSEWALRFPSALAALLTCLALILFSIKSLKDKRIGILACLILVSNVGFVRYHVTRTADLDALLTLFISLFTLLIFHLFLKGQNIAPRNIFILIGLLFLAYFTKSTAALLPVAGILVGSIWKKRITLFTGNRFFYLFSLAGIMLVALYYWSVNNLHPGYFEKVWFSEFQRLTNNIMPWHDHPFYRYWEMLYFEKYFMNFIFIFSLIPIFIFIGNEKQRHISFLIFSFVLCNLLFISFPHTKIAWYMAPLFPIMSLGTSLVIVYLIDWLGGQWPSVKKYRSHFFSIAIALILFFPFRQTFLNQDYGPRIDLEYHGEGVKILKATRPDFKNYDLFMFKVNPRHMDQARFYARAYSHYYGFEMDLISDQEDINLAKPILVCLQNDIDLIKKNFVITIEEKIEKCRLMTLAKK